MRMLLALLLGLYLAWPARAADSGPVLLLPGLPAPAAEAAPGPRCADFLDEAGLRPEGLEYLFCRPATDPRTGRRTLTARYRVPGAGRPSRPLPGALTPRRRKEPRMAQAPPLWTVPLPGRMRPLRRVLPLPGRPAR